jgi:membrane protein required for colicin V production
MESFPLNPADIIVIIVLFISSLLAFSRGAVREILGVSAWVGAALATVFAFSPVRPYPREWVTKTWPELDLGESLADAGTGLVLFIIFLIILTIINQMISGYVQRSRMGALDRSLGFIFGLLRGAVLICLAYMLFIWVVKNPDDHPHWIEEAQSISYVKMGAQIIHGITPAEFRKKAKDKAVESKDSFDKFQNVDKSIRALSEPTSNKDIDKEQKGYGTSERKAMDGLSNSVQD